MTESVLTGKRDLSERRLKVWSARYLNTGCNYRGVMANVG